VDAAFRELARLWRPLLDLAQQHGLVFTYELHPGSDLFDGATFEMFLEQVEDHPAACLNYDPSHLVLQQLDYLEFLRLYGRRIKAFHVKDAEFRPNGRVGVYGGYQSWLKRAGRFRSLGDGQVDFRRVFSLLTEAGFTGWAVLEWDGRGICWGLSHVVGFGNGLLVRFDCDLHRDINRPELKHGTIQADEASHFQPGTTLPQGLRRQFMQESAAAKDETANIHLKSNADEGAPR